MRLTYLRLHHENQSASPEYKPVFRSNAEGSLWGNLSMRLTIIELVVKLIGRPPRRSKIAGSWLRSKGVDLGPTGRGRGREAEVAAPKSVCATPHKALRNPINRLRCDPNLDSTTYTITKIKTWSWCCSHKTYRRALWFSWCMRKQVKLTWYSNLIRKHLTSWVSV